MLRSHLRPMARQVAHLEARFAPAPPAELNPFLHYNVVAEVEQAAARFRTHLSRTAKRWQTAPEDFGSWEGRSPIDKLITAATPEQAEEALQLFERLREERRARQSEFDRRRQEQYYAAYEWQRRHQVDAVRVRAQTGARGPAAGRDDGRTEHRFGSSQPVVERR